MSSMESRINKLREASGNVAFNDALTGFLYELMRDHMPAGKVEEMVHRAAHNPDALFTNGWLAQYANNLAEELRNAQVKQLAEALENALASNQAEKKEPSDKRPSFKIQSPIKKLKEDIQKEEQEDEAEETNDYGLSSIDHLERTGQLDKAQADKIRKEIEEVRRQNQEEAQGIVHTSGGEAPTEPPVVTTNESDMITFTVEDTGPNMTLVEEEV